MPNWKTILKKIALNVSAGAASLCLFAATAVAQDFTERCNSGTYIVGPFDVLEVDVFEQATFSRVVNVGLDGKMSTPLNQDMQASGRTASEIAEEITSILSTYLRTPEVTVIIVEGVSALCRVRVIGQAVDPGSVPYRSGLTLLDVMESVGGLSDSAAGNRSTLLRVTNGETTETGVRLEDLLEDGDLTADVAVQAGDVITIPRARF